MITVYTYCVVLCIVALLLIACMVRSTRSKRSISKEVFWVLCFSLIEVITNLGAVLSASKLVSTVFLSVYVATIDFEYYAILMFVMKFCGFDFGGKKFKITLFSICSAVGAIALTNPITHWLFELEDSNVGPSAVYADYVYKDLSVVTRTISYFFILTIAIVLIHKLVIASRLVADRYVFNLVCFGLASLINIFTGIRFGYNNSVICLGVYGVIVYYYSLEYVQLKLIDRMKSTIVSTVRDAVLFFDENRRCIYANNAAKMVFDIKNDEDMENIRTTIIEVLGESEESIVDIKNKHCKVRYSIDDNDNIFLAEYHKLFDGKGTQIGSFVNFNDVTEITLKAEKDHYLAAHDALTGLYNGRYFLELVGERLAEVNPEEYVAIVSDIRGFKLINDKYGHEVGDEILKTIGEVVDKNCSISSRTLYSRFMTDRFAIFTHKSLVSEERLAKVLNDINDSIDSKYSVIVHVGVYELTAADREASSIFDKALIAIGSVKNNLDQRVAYYSSQMREALNWEQKINATLDEAIRRGRIVPYLQAQVDGSGNVVGAEVLVRWIDDDGIIPPFRFIPVLEKNGTISKVDLCMWENACKILKEWEQQGRKDMYLSVNVSPKDFYLLDVVKEMKNLVDKYGINPRNLRLEITESMMMDDANMKMSILDELRDAGFIIEMDDFGSGYSSLNLLKDMPVDIIKLDMMFMSKTTNQERTDIIVNLIIKLAYELGLTVIAEGVETKEQYNNLMGMGCRSFQGYYFSKPIPLSDFEKAM